MKQQKCGASTGPLAGLRRVDRAVGEKSIHAGLVCSRVARRRRRKPALIGSSLDRSKFGFFKPLWLDVIFHDCKIEPAI